MTADMFSQAERRRIISEERKISTYRAHAEANADLDLGAIACLPHVTPKLAVMGMVSEQSFAELLDRRLRHMAQLEANGNSPQQIEQPETIETTRPMARTTDRRFCRM
jgi:hypothetical protein